MARGKKRRERRCELELGSLDVPSSSSPTQHSPENGELARVSSKDFVNERTLVDRDWRIKRTKERERRGRGGEVSIGELGTAAVPSSPGGLGRTCELTSFVLTAPPEG